MISLNIKKGFKLNIDGKPSLELKKTSKPLEVAVLPSNIPYIKPRLQVQTGDKVKIGTILFEDKRNPEIKFLSPGGGKISQIIFGEKRAVSEIIVALDEKEEYEIFETITENDLSSSNKEKIIRALMEGGVWSFLREFPFRDIARPNFEPPIIFVNIENFDPYHPTPEVYLKNKKDLFIYGIKILKALCPNVYVYASNLCSYALEELEEILTYKVSGVYPANDPGVILYQIRKSSSQNKSWYIKGQDLLLVAELLKTGKYPIERIVSIGGSLSSERKHIETRLGSPIEDIIAGAIIGETPARIIVGGIFKGYKSAANSFLGLYETSVMLVSESREKELFGFLRPGFNKPSYSRTFLSYFNKVSQKVDCNLHGEERACISCGACASVCAVDMLPQFVFKCILADEIEEALSYGLLDCVECGLCTYVCPSKIEISEILKKAKELYYKEQT
ncbi:MAG: NADH:ubiquinone reductase (Na(+)-transporting) subunit A [Desulfobacterales bacterium]|nr:NADH:ubiquinone reductase (Na(+)-transporting) subunit A [Desulfobacterales bacterium]